MTPTHAAAVLRQLTDWRRGVDVEPPKPGEVFEAIDAAIALFERTAAAEKERELWTAIKDGMVTPGHLAVGESVPMVENTSHLAEVERERNALRVELETERVRLAACGVVALANTPDSAKQAREMRQEYWSASCGDVARMVDENIKLRAKVAEMENQVPIAHVWRCDNGHIHGSCERTLPMGAKLYALPGAKGEEK